MASLSQVAEEARRIYLANPNADSMKKQREFELHAVNALSWIIKLNYFNVNNEGERSVNEVWLKSYDVEAEKSTDGKWFFCLPALPVDLPNDIGLFAISPKGVATGDYIKTKVGRYKQVGSIPTLLKFRYFRVNQKVFLPDGLMGEVKDLEVMMCKVPDIDCDEPDLIPDDFALLVVKEILNLVNNSNPKTVSTPIA